MDHHRVSVRQLREDVLATDTVFLAGPPFPPGMGGPPFMPPPGMMVPPGMRE